MATVVPPDPLCDRLLDLARFKNNLWPVMGASLLVPLVVVVQQAWMARRDMRRSHAGGNGVEFYTRLRRLVSPLLAYLVLCVAGWVSLDTLLGTLGLSDDEQWSLWRLCLSPYCASMVFILALMWAHETNQRPPTILLSVHNAATWTHWRVRWIRRTRRAPGSTAIWNAQFFAALLLKHVALVVSTILAGFALNVLPAVHSAWKARADESHKQAEKASVIANDFSAFRAALTALGSDCLERIIPAGAGDARAQIPSRIPSTAGRAAMAQGSSSLDVLQSRFCRKIYARVLDSWVRSTWVLPSYAREVYDRHCKETNPHGLLATACQKLEGEASLGASTWAYRRFVHAYQNALVDRNQDECRTSALFASVTSLYKASREFGCALMYVATEKDGESRFSCYCRELLTHECGTQEEQECRLRDGGIAPDGTERDPIEWHWRPPAPLRCDED